MTDKMWLIMVIQVEGPINDAAMAYMSECLSLSI